MVRRIAEITKRVSVNRMECSVVVAIDKDKGSQYALKWAVNHFLNKGQAVTLLHVVLKSPPAHPSSGGGYSKGNDKISKTQSKHVDSEARDLFLPFRCCCMRKDITCYEVTIEDVDIPKAIVNYVSTNVMKTLILGTPTRGGMLIRKFKATDVPSTVSKSAPDFCNVYTISKGRVSSLRSATVPPPAKPSPQVTLQHKPTHPARLDAPHCHRRSHSKAERLPFTTNPNNLHDRTDIIRSPFKKGKYSNGKPYEPYELEMDISFVSNGRPSSKGFDYSSFGSMLSTGTSIDLGSLYSDSSRELGGFSCYSHDTEDMESEMKRLRRELKQTMDMYSSAYNEAASAKQKSTEYQQWKVGEQHRVKKARLAEEAALALLEKKAKSQAAIEATQAAHKIAAVEAQRRMSIEMKSHVESDETKKVRDSYVPADIKYRRYTIEEIEAATNGFSDHLKIGEGGYGPVYRCYLDHTEVALKVLRADAAQGMSQFHQEIEVLSCIRHPNMVLLLGACPEYGCLVYEYMASGSLDDRLFRRGHTLPLPWQVRFRIAAEIATGLLFLHQNKPEPIVHRDLKPGNILLDRNFVSKVSDVGLARLVPPSVADAVTQYRMTATAGTFCYIDPEYQQTGMLGTKSDIYSLGILLLQIITAKRPMGLAHQVKSAIGNGKFGEVLDPTVSDWPMEETLGFARLALQCAELRKKDRPELGKVILPELNRLRAFAEENAPYPLLGRILRTASTPSHNHCLSLKVS